LNNKYLLYLLAAVIFVAGFAFWCSDLTSDPPMYYSGLGQSLSTDPAQYVYHARNKVLFGDADPFDYPRWIVYQNSLTSLVGYIVFSIAGVSQANANLVGVLLSFAGLLFLLLGLVRHHSPWVLAAVALCYVINVTLLTYGRLSYLENGLICWAAMMFFVYSRWGNRLWGVMLSGAVAAMAMLTGKLFGGLLAPALVLAIFVSNEGRKWRDSIASVASFLATAAVFILIVYGTDFSAAFSYFGEQSYGLRGLPQGLQSPWAFLESLVAYGYKNRLFYCGPDLWLFIILGGALIPFGGKVSRIRHMPRSARLALFWLCCGILGLMPLNYSPIRYGIFLIPAIITFCFVMLDSYRRNEAKSPLDLSLPSLGIFLYLCWFGLFHLVGNAFYFNDFLSRQGTWTLALAAAALVFLFWLVARKRRLQAGNRLTTGILLITLALSLTANGFRIRRSHYLDHNFNIKEANQDLAEILSPDAVVSGPYGPVLTLNTNLKSFIHLFGVARVDSTLFDRHGVTHLALDISNFDEAMKLYPEMEKASVVTAYWIRDYKVNLLDVSQCFNNPQARAYRPSPFEHAIYFYRTGQHDSAYAALEQFYQTSPRGRSKSAGLLLSSLLSRRGQVKAAHQIEISLAEDFPTDFSLQLECARFTQTLAMDLKDNRLLQLAMKYYDRAVKVNRFKGAYAYDVFLETRKRHSSQEDPLVPGDSL